MRWRVSGHRAPGKGVPQEEMQHRRPAEHSKLGRNLGVLGGAWPEAAQTWCKRSGGGAQWTRPVPRGPQERVILWGSHSGVFWGPSEASRRVEAGKALVGVWGSNTKTNSLWV